MPFINVEMYCDQFSVYGSCALRPDTWRESLQFQRPHGCEAASAVSAGHDHKETMDGEPRNPRRFIQRPDVASQAEPRAGVAYNIPKTNTVLRASYARTMESPFNENLVLSSTGCNFPVIAALCRACPAPLEPGYRNEFHAGLQQAFGRYLVVYGEYIWKYTHTGYDFSDPGEYADLLPDWLAQLEDSRMGDPRERANHSRIQRACGDVQCGRTIFPAAEQTAWE